MTGPGDISSINWRKQKSKKEKRRNKGESFNSPQRGTLVVTNGDLFRVGNANEER